MTPSEIEYLAERIAFHLYRHLKPELMQVEEAEDALADAAHDTILQTVQTFEAVADQLRSTLNGGK